METETKRIILRKGTGTPTTLAEAELGFATDTKRLFVGTGSGSVKVLEEKGHTHDDRYYTETEMNTLLSKKASSTHGHRSLSLTSLGQLTALGSTSIEGIANHNLFMVKFDIEWADGVRSDTKFIVKDYGSASTMVHDTSLGATVIINAYVDSTNTFYVDDQGVATYALLTGPKLLQVQLYGVTIQ